MSRTLIKGGWILTMGRTNYAAADVLIEGESVAEVGSRLRARDAEVVDAADSIVIPGFVDTHRHASESLFRNLGSPPDPTSEGPGQLYRPEDVYAATLIGLLGAADAGITTVADWCTVASDDDRLAAALRAHEDSGMRTVLVVAPFAGRPGWEAALRRAARADVPARTTVAAGVAATGRTEVEQTAVRVATARDLDLRIHLHLGASEPSGEIIAELARRDLLGEDVAVVHGSHLDEAALDALAAAGSAVVLAPSSEMAAGLGAPPIQELIDRDIRPGLATGSERLAPGDAFAQMRAAISVQHATRFDLKLAGKAGLPRLMTTRDIIRHATIDGARVLGLDRAVGSIEPGKQADITVLSADRPNIYPINDPIGAVVWGMDTSNVAWAFVAGRAIKRRGELTADVDKARALAAEAHRRVVTATGTASLASGAQA